MSQDRIRQQISIENLLGWAYGEQMVHQARQTPVELGVKSSNPLASYSTIWNEVAPVEGSRRSGFDAAPDAWRIHQAVQQLGRVTLDLGQDLAAARYHAMPRGSHGVEPPTGRRSTADHAGDPWPTNGVVVIDVRTTVILHATKLTRPDVPYGPKVRFKPEDMVRHPKSKGGAYRWGWYQHIRAVGDLKGDVAEAHARYEAWWNALNSLRATFTANLLTMFVVTREMPPPAKKPA